MASKQVTSPTVLDRLNATDECTLFAEAVRAARLEHELANESPRTLFAPTNHAIDTALGASFSALMKQPPLLHRWVSNHIIPRAVALTGGHLQRVATLAGRHVTVVEDGGTMKVNNATIERSDTSATNGPLYLISVPLSPDAILELQQPNDAPWDDWFPYRPGQALPIGDAELVAGDPFVIEHCAKLAEQLLSYQAQLNTARAVRLTERGETTYRIPRGRSGPPLSAAAARSLEHGIITGALIVDGTSKLERGPYLERLIAKASAGEPVLSEEQAEASSIDARSEWYVELLNSAGMVVRADEAIVRTSTPIDDAPTAAIFYGSKLCNHQDGDRTVCTRCYWYELVPWVPACGGDQS